MGQQSIDSLYESLTMRMTRDNTIQETSLELRRTGNNSAVVQRVYGVIDRYKMFPQFVGHVKSSEVSQKYRQMGNAEFNNRRYSEALKMYNLALVNAPINSQEQCLAYSNRSAVNFSLNNYSACLKDIDRVMKFACDNQLVEKLNNRKTRCVEAANQNPSNKEEIEEKCQRQFNLSRQRHKTIPAVSESIDLFYSVEMGRGVIATQDILPGEVLAFEEPYCCLILKPFYLEYCYMCLKQSDALIPCDSCCAVMFCDEQCKELAHNKFHRIDCKIIDMLAALGFTKIELLALRTVIQAKCTYSSCEELCKCIYDAESIVSPLLRGFVKNPQTNTVVLDSSSYPPIHMLDTNRDKRDVSDLFQKAVTASVFLHILIKYSDFFNQCNVDHKREYFHHKCINSFGGLLLHHCMTSPSNMHTICTVAPTLSKGYIDSSRFGGGAYAFHSMLNHSCSPNVVRENRGAAMALVALRPIQKGQQIFDNYGHHHATESLQDRQSSLKFQYKFTCQCEACVENWPLYFDLPFAKIYDPKDLQIVSQSLLTKELFDCLTQGNRLAALDKVNNLYPYLIALEKYIPCKELADYQETIKQCWALFGNVAPLRVILNK